MYIKVHKQDNEGFCPWDIDTPTYLTFQTKKQLATRSQYNPKQSKVQKQNINDDDFMSYQKCIQIGSDRTLQKRSNQQWNDGKSYQNQKTNNWKSKTIDGKWSSVKQQLQNDRKVLQMMGLESIQKMKLLKEHKQYMKSSKSYQIQNKQIRFKYQQDIQLKNSVNKHISQMINRQDDSVLWTSRKHKEILKTASKTIQSKFYHQNRISKLQQEEFRQKIPKNLSMKFPQLNKEVVQLQKNDSTIF